MKCRIGIDAHVLDGKSQGSSTVLTRLLQSIPPERSSEIVIYSASELMREKFSDKNFFYKRLRSNNPVIRLLFEIPYLLRRDGIQIGLFQYISPFWNGKKAIVVHDILPIIFPKLFPLMFRIRFRILCALSIWSASAILTVSEESRRQIVQRFPSKALKVHVVSNGPSFDMDAYFRKSSAQRIADRKYVLAVGRIERRKNIGQLVRAFIAADLKGVELCIVGRPDLGFRLEIPTEPSVKIVSGVSDAELIELYCGASLFVYPSLAEGFGIPLLDATLFGLPTISSDRTSLPEVGRDLVEYYDPLAPNAEVYLTGRIREHFCGVPIEAPELAKRLAQSQLFSWDRAGEQFLKILDSLCVGIEGALPPSPVTNEKPRGNADPARQT